MKASQKSAPEEHSTGLDPKNLLGDFLWARRAQLTPEQAGIASFGTRRVPGLRREELSQLAGVSVNYYTRLEQGEAMHPSASIIGAIARALCLEDDETTYLHNIAGTAEQVRTSIVAPQPGMGEGLPFEKIVEFMPETASITLSPTKDVLSYTRLAYELFFKHLLEDESQWNTNRMLFMDPYTRKLYRNWAEEASLAVASLRFDAALNPTNSKVRELVGELSVGSDEFARLWAEHPVKRCTRGRKYLLHPELGELELDYQVLRAPDGDGRYILIHTAPEGSATAETLNRLHHEL